MHKNGLPNTRVVMEINDKYHGYILTLITKQVTIFKDMNKMREGEIITFHGQKTQREIIKELLLRIN